MSKEQKSQDAILLNSARKKLLNKLVAERLTKALLQTVREVLREQAFILTSRETHNFWDGFAELGAFLGPPHESSPLDDALALYADALATDEDLLVADRKARQNRPSSTEKPSWPTTTTSTNQQS